MSTRHVRWGRRVCAWAVACGSLACLNGPPVARAESGPPDAKKVRKWIREIEKNGKHAVEAVVELRTLGPAISSSTSEVRALVHSENEHVRVNALDVLAMVAPAESEPIMKERALNDPSERVREVAVARMQDGATILEVARTSRGVARDVALRRLDDEALLEVATKHADPDARADAWFAVMDSQGVPEEYAWREPPRPPRRLLRGRDRLEKLSRQDPDAEVRAAAQLALTSDPKTDLVVEKYLCKKAAKGLDMIRCDFQIVNKGRVAYLWPSWLGTGLLPGTYVLLPRIDPGVSLTGTRRYSLPDKDGGRYGLAFNKVSRRIRPPGGSPGSATPAVAP